MIPFNSLDCFLSHRRVFCTSNLNSSVFYKCFYPRNKNNKRNSKYYIKFLCDFIIDIAFKLKCCKTNANLSLQERRFNLKKWNGIQCKILWQREHF